MKSKRYLSLIVLFTTLFTACATPPISSTATNVPSGTPTSPPIETTLPTVTPTSEPTPTPKPTATEKPTTAPTEIALPPLEEQLVNLTAPQEAEVLETIMNQHPVAKENGAWRELCVSGPIVTHDPPVELPGSDLEMSHSFLCNNGQGLFHLYAYAHSFEDETDKIIGYLPDDTSKDLIESLKRVFSKEPLPTGVVGMLERAGWSGVGHIFNLAVAPVDEVDDFTHLTERGYFNEAIKAMYPSRALENFFRTGDGAYLQSDTYQTADGYPILFPVNVSFDHIFGNWQFQNSQQE